MLRMFSGLSDLRTLLGAALVGFALLPPPVLPASTQATFNVRVAIKAPDAPSSAFCRVGPSPTTFGAVVTVVCETGAVVNIEPPAGQTPFRPIHGGAYRFHHVSDNVLFGGYFAGGIDIYTGVGTITTWRVVTLPDWEYLEMQMAW